MSQSNCTTASLRICNQSAVLRCCDSQFLGHSSALRDGQIHRNQKEREGGIYRKMGLHCTLFLQRIHLKTQLACPRFLFRALSIGLQLNKLSGDVDPGLQRAWQRSLSSGQRVFNGERSFWMYSVCIVMEGWPVEESEKLTWVDLSELVFRYQHRTILKPWWEDFWRARRAVSPFAKADLDPGVPPKISVSTWGFWRAHSYLG